MGPYERLCRMFDLPVPEPGEIAKHEAGAVLGRPLGISEERVQALVARFQADPEVMARFRATAPPDEAMALRDAAKTLLAADAAEANNREMTETAEAEGEAADVAPWPPGPASIGRAYLILIGAMRDIIVAIDRALAEAGGVAEATVPATALLGLRERAEAASESAALSITWGDDDDEPADPASAPGAPTSLD